MAMRTRIEHRPMRFYEVDELMPVLVMPGGRVYIGSEPPIITEEEEDGSDSPRVAVRR